MLMNELELSYRCNSGWHCKKMVSCLVLKLINHNSWFGQFFVCKVSINSSTSNMFCRLESLVRVILQKIFYRFERNLDTLDTTCWLIHVLKKKNQVFDATEYKSRWLFLKSNLVLKNNVESVRCNLYEL